MKHLLHLGAILASCILCTQVLQAQLEEDFTPHPANWILANGYSYHAVNGNDVILSANGNSPGTIGTPIVQKSANTVNVCFDFLGYTPQDGLTTTLPCNATVDIYFTNSAVNNGNDLNDPNNIYGSVLGVSLSGGKNCTSFTFPASVTASTFRVFFTITPACDWGNVRFAIDNFVITGLTEVCTGAACAPVALPDVFNVGNPSLFSLNVVLYGNNPNYPAPPSGYLAYAPGIDNDPNDAYSALTWSLATPPTNGTVTMNPAGQGTATITRNDLTVTQLTFVYQLCDPDGNCDTAAVTVNYPAGAALPVSVINYKGNRNGAAVTLNWTTVTESNNAGFEVQRMVNGVFTKVGFVSSKALGGNCSTPLNYQFVEDNSTNAVSWYRLVEVGLNGAQKTYPSLAVRGLNNLQKMLIYPNPGATVNVLFGSSSVRDVLITDVMGRLVKFWNNYGDDNLTIYGLPTGMYMLKITDRNTHVRTVSKIMIKK